MRAGRRRGRHQQRPLRHAARRRPLATALAAVRARRSLDELDGWLPAGGRRPPALGRRAGPPVRPLPRAWSSAAAELGLELRVRPRARRARTCRRSRARDGPRRDGVPPPPHRARAPRAATAPAARTERGARRLRTRSTTSSTSSSSSASPATSSSCGTSSSSAAEPTSSARAGARRPTRAVCYALGITNADAVRLGLLFERFLSPERDGPPDIDIDIESDRREEVIQYVYERYGRQQRRAGRQRHHLPGPVGGARHGQGARLRARPAGRLVASRSTAWGRVAATARPGRPRHPRSRCSTLAARGRALPPPPRHPLGRHGASATARSSRCARSSGAAWRTARVLQWDKDDCAAAGLVKFDLLGLGMLTALHYAVDLIREHHGYERRPGHASRRRTRSTTCCAGPTRSACSRSRAGPRWPRCPGSSPRTFYDLVVEVALIRPGPDPGRVGAPLHPPPQRHRSRSPTCTRCSSTSLAQDARRAAVPGAAHADGHRRRRVHRRPRPTSCARPWARSAAGERMERLRAAALRRAWPSGASPATWPTRSSTSSPPSPTTASPRATRCRFAYLVYASSWIKLHYPAAFCAALLNAQPMGFYSPHTLVQDARRHGVEVRTPDLDALGARARCWSRARTSHNGVAVRLGLSSVRGIGQDLAEALVAERDAHGPFADLADLSRRTGLTRPQLEALALAGAAPDRGLKGRREIATATLQTSAEAPPRFAGPTRQWPPPTLQTLGRRPGRARQRAGRGPRRLGNRRAALWEAGAAAQSRPGRLPGIVTGTDAPRCRACPPRRRRSPTCGRPG